MKTEDRQRQQARTERLAHPLHAQLIPEDQIEDAPEPIRTAQADAIRAVTSRRSVVGRHREAESAVRLAPIRDDEAGRQALSQGKPVPAPTAGQRKAELVEMRRQFQLAKQTEADALEHLAEVKALHGDAWQAKLDLRLRDEADETAEVITAALDKYRSLDRLFALARWNYEHDPEHPLPISKAPSLDPDAERCLEEMIAKVREAPRRATAGESGRQVRARLRTERRAKRRKVAA